MRLHFDEISATSLYKHGLYRYRGEAVPAEPRPDSLVQSLDPERNLRRWNQQPDDVLFYRFLTAVERNFRVNVLLPFVENDTLISCGVIDKECGYCEVLDLMNISNLLHRESIQVGPLRSSSASVAVLVNLEKNPPRSDTYILTGVQQHPNNTEPTLSSCTSNIQTVNLHNTDDKQRGGIFSITDDQRSPTLESKGDVEFVDGFQISSTMYLLSNVLSGAKSNKVRLIWLEGRSSKTQTYRSLRGATLSVSEAGGEGNRLLASSVIPGGPSVLWSGVFSVDGGQSNTELLVFDISPDLTGEDDSDPDFCSVCSKKTRVAKDYHTACPVMLYRANDDRQVFPKILLDPVDHKHVYVPFQNQMKCVPVSKCSMYTNVQECWSAQDPHCVWCGSETRCTFEDDCTDSDWVSIPDDHQHKIVSYKVEKEPTGQRPVIPITPSVARSFYGRNHAVLSGQNLRRCDQSEMTGGRRPHPPESPVWNNTGVSLTLHIPRTDGKGVVKVCALLPDGGCHGNSKITYRSLPSCTKIVPSSSWVRSHLMGLSPDLVEGVTQPRPQRVRPPGSSNYQNLTYDTPAAENTLKKADKLEMTTAELSVWGVQEGKQYPCIMKSKEITNEIEHFICEIKNTSKTNFQKIMIKYGDEIVNLHLKSSGLLLILLVLLLIPCIIIMVAFVYRRKQNQLTAEMNRLMEDLELDIRNDIRQGFVDLQTEKADLMENVGAIPFLDYKHFASRIFFPKSEHLMMLCIKDIGQDAEKVQLDECCQGLSKLIQDQLFLTSMVHALEEQKSFTIED
ncbi:plexin-C1, partial [Lates japonicus]